MMPIVLVNSTMVTPSSGIQPLGTSRQKGGLFLEEDSRVLEKQQIRSQMQNRRSRFTHSADDGNLYTMAADLIDEAQTEQRVNTPQPSKHHLDRLEQDIADVETLLVSLPAPVSVSVSVSVSVPVSVTKEGRSEYLIRNMGGGSVPRSEGMESEESVKVKETKEHRERVKVIVRREGQDQEGEGKEERVATSIVGNESNGSNGKQQEGISEDILLPVDNSSKISLPIKHITTITPMGPQSDHFTNPEENSSELNTKNKNTALFDRKKHQLSRRIMNTVLPKNIEEDDLFDGGFF